jgi:hypothetical protein
MIPVGVKPREDGVSVTSCGSEVWLDGYTDRRSQRKEGSRLPPWQHSLRQIPPTLKTPGEEVERDQEM